MNVTLKDGRCVKILHVIPCSLMMDEVWYVVQTEGRFQVPIKHSDVETMVNPSDILFPRITQKLLDAKRKLDEHFNNV